MAPETERPVTPTLSVATTVKVTDSLVLLVVSSTLLALLENEVIFGATVSVLLILTTRS